ncbi:MAG: hypothetical protein WAT39_14895 [Planctomycetota bacterium]
MRTSIRVGLRNGIANACLGVSGCVLLAAAGCNGSSSSPPPLTQLLVEEFDSAGAWALTTNFSVGSPASASAEIRDGGLFLSASQASTPVATATARLAVQTPQPSLAGFQLLIDGLRSSGYLSSGSIRVELANISLRIFVNRPLPANSPGEQLSFRCDGPASSLTIDGVAQPSSSYQFTLLAAPTQNGFIEFVAAAASADAGASCSVRLDRFQLFYR